MSVPVAQRSFAGGEVSPFLYGRTDQVKYETGLRTMRNMIALRQGGATNRPGTQFIDSALNGGNAVRLIPFIFNETGNGQSYVLEFGNLYVAFIQNGARVLSGGNPYTVVTPYLQADISSLQFAESADVVTITHPNYPPYELKRLAQTNWTLTQVVIATGALSINNLTAFAPIAGTFNGTYAVTGIDPLGEESVAKFVTVTNIATPSVTDPVFIDWFFIGQVNGNNQYSYFKVYLNPTNNPTSGFGFIGSLPNNNTGGARFIDTGFTPDFSNSPTINNTFFNSVGNYPSTVGFVQQRRGFANTDNNPIGFWLSYPGSFSNFDVHVIPEDSDAIIGTVAGSEVNAIQHLLELKFMLLLTAGAEIYVQGNGNGVVTPSAINAATQSQYGANQIRPLRIADSVIFNQALGNTIRDLRFDFVINGYNGNELTVFSTHLFEGFQIVDWDFQKIPDSIVWAVRDDGILLALTYSREQQMLAWSRHDFTNGLVENVCCIPENGNYATYLCINRVINGSTVRYIERMSSRIWSDVLNATYLDCFSQYNGTNQNLSLAMQLTSPTGTFDQTSSAYQQKLTLSSNTPYFTSDMAGDQIFLSNADFVKNKGNMVDPENDGSSFALSTEGNQIRCTIISFQNSTSVTVTPNKLVQTSFQNVAIVTWARAVMKLAGLSYLAGQAVSVWADRFVVASPNNVNVTFKATVGLDGTLTLDKHYAVIYVGLPMTSDLETLDIETAFGETSLSKRKRQLKLAMFLLQTRTLFAGTENPDSNFDNTTQDMTFQLNEFKTGMNRQNYDQPPELVTDQDWILEVTRWNRNGRIFVRNVDPTPLTILAVSPGGDYSVENPGYTRI